MKPFQNTKEIGDFGESKAVHYLRLHGYTVKERNWRSGKCEIDIIATTLHDIVFAEVKTRTYTQEQLANAAPPRMAVHAEKQRLTRRAANDYLRTHFTKKRPRMDVIEVWLIQSPKGDRPRVFKIQHFKAAY
ncbi:MAG: YraN family protein [Clostridia bacterium]|nr:YraN family protein [Clostridia bacterium]